MDLIDKLKELAIECTEAESKDFAEWGLKRMWNDYIKDCMDKRVVIENRVKDLPIVIPNATVGKEYKTTFNLPSDLVDDAWIEGLEATGLSCTNGENNTYIISGTPTEAGTFDIKLCYKYAGWIEGKPVLERKFTFAVNPDPKTLWKNIPTPTDIEYFKTDSDSAYVKVEAIDGNPQKDIVAASQRGRSHAHEGKPRDDHFCIEYQKDSGWYVMAVADGAGSAPFSREGSRIACTKVMVHCVTFFHDEKKMHDFEEYIVTYNDKPGDSDYRKLLGDYIYQLIGTAAFKAYKAIEAEAIGKNRPIKVYATTLLLAVCKKFDFGWFVASFWVGDGAMCIYDKERQYFKLMGTPDEGEFAGQTRFLTMPEIFKDSTSFYSRLKFSIEQDFTALFLMSDGVSDPMFETDANLNKIEKWNALWDNITKEVELTDDNDESQNQLLKWLDFWSPGNHDDRTIAILY